MKPVRRGEVWFADLGAPSGREQAYKRTVVVIQNDALRTLGTTIVPTTTKLTRMGVRILPAEGGLDELSVAKPSKSASWMSKSFYINSAICPAKG